MNMTVERRAVNGHLITVVTVVRIMGAVAIIGLVGILILSFLGRPVPDLLAGIHRRGFDRPAVAAGSNRERSAGGKGEGR